jgi:two-component system, chemotaxis family, response regulator Rcp1
MNEAVTLIDILLVEDNDGDARLAEELLREGRVPSRVFRVVDGEEAMAFLRKEGSYAGAPCPHLVLLDLNMPRKDGREVLAEIRGDERLKGIPVVVLTTSNDEDDIFRMMSLGASGYIKKSVDLGQFLKALRSIDDFRFTLVVETGQG